MAAVDGLLVKGGADGVHVAALPGRGAVALKLDDGGDRGARPRCAPGCAARRPSGHWPLGAAARPGRDGVVGRGAGRRAR
jgi:hypothetical protein